MSEGVEGRREQAERLRDYFEVQLLFAEAMADRTSRSLSDACLTFTNLHRRFGLGRADGGAASAGWMRYAEGLERCRARPERLQWTVDFLAETPPEAPARDVFGCFRYDLLEPGGVVRIHFTNRESDDGCGPLVHAKADRRRAELRAMFAHIEARHPGARAVQGGSWLYNLEAYRRLFPPPYAASAFAPEHLRLDGTSSWGQLLDYRGRVKPAVRQALIDNIARLDPAAPWTAFPLRALGASCGIEAFHRFYGGA